MSVGLLGRDGEDVSGSLTTRPFGVREKLPLPQDFHHAGEEHLTRLRLQFEERVSQPVSIRCRDPWLGARRIAKNTAPFLACDLLVLVTAIAVAGSLTAVLTQGALFGVATGAWLALGGLATLAATGNYFLMGTSPVVELRRLAVGTTAFVAITLVVFRAQQLPFVASALFASLNCALLLVGLMAARVLLRSQLRRCSWWGEPLLILGEPQACQRVYDRVQREAERGLRPIILHTGYAKPDASRRYIRIKSEEQVSAWVRRLGAAWAIIAEPTETEDVAMWRYLVKDVPHVLVERDCTLPSLWTQAKELGSSAALYLRNELAMPVPCAIKRTADVLISGALLILLLPLFVAIATAILLASRGPIFYGHRRYGRNQEPFKAWKFRTMVSHADEALERYLSENPQARLEWERDQKLRHDPRVIPVVGAVLRQWSLDELPQLWNVFVGEMSLVGPRPIVDEEIVRYGDDFYAYQLVRPGITGLWQVSGRNKTTYAARVEFDKYYVQNWSPWLDIYILIRTVPTVLFREGAY